MDNPRFTEVNRNQFLEGGKPTQNYNELYFSLLCRNGPLPLKYHKTTDIPCLAVYLILVIGMLVLSILNGTGQYSISDRQVQLLNEDVFFGTNYFLWETLSSAGCILVISMIMTLISLALPGLMAGMSVLMLLAASAYFTYRQVNQFFQRPEKPISYLLTGAISFVMLLVTLFVLIGRRDKIANLGMFLSMSYQVIKTHLCSIFTHMLLLSLVEVGIWIGFVNLYLGVATTQHQNLGVIPILTKILVLVVWLWTNGLFIAIADYFIHSYTINWFYYFSLKEERPKKKKKERKAQRENAFDEQQQYSVSSSSSSSSSSDEASDQSSQDRKKRRKKIQKQQSQMMENGHRREQVDSSFLVIYKHFFKHLGTIVFGSILAYLPLFILSMFQKWIFKSSTKQFALATYSKYGYLDTIMEWQPFHNANYRVYKLRRRVKTVMPELYMLGNMYGDFTKVALTLIGIVLIHEFIALSENNEDISNEYFVPYLVTLLMFGVGVGLQIATNFTNLIGKCGDIAYLLYCVDSEIERVHYSNNSNYSTPISLMRILRKLTIKRQWKDDKR